MIGTSIVPVNSSAGVGFKHLFSRVWVNGYELPSLREKVPVVLVLKGCTAGVGVGSKADV